MRLAQSHRRLTVRIQLSILYSRTISLDWGHLLSVDRHPSAYFLALPLFALIHSYSGVLIFSAVYVLQFNISPSRRKSLFSIFILLTLLELCRTSPPRSRSFIIYSTLVVLVFPTLVVLVYQFPQNIVAVSAFQAKNIVLCPKDASIQSSRKGRVPESVDVCGFVRFPSEGPSSRALIVAPVSVSKYLDKFCLFLDAWQIAATTQDGAKS